MTFLTRSGRGSGHTAHRARVCRLVTGIALVCTWLLPPVLAAAQTGATGGGRQYVVVTAIGQRLSIVKSRQSRGSQFTGTTEETFPVTDGTFDDAILDASEKVLRELQGGTGPRVLRTRVSGMLVDPASYELQPGAVSRLIEALRPSMSDAAHARLVIVAPIKAPMNLEIEKRFTRLKGYVGEGTQAGLGYYLDGEAVLWNDEVKVQTRGFLAVFANLQFVLVDVDHGAVVAREIATESSMYTTAKSDSAEPWDALSAPEKLTAMRRLLAVKVNRHLRALVGANP